MEKFVFHIPSHCIHEDEVWACANYNFKRELIGAFTEVGDDYFFIVPAKKFSGVSSVPLRCSWCMIRRTLAVCILIFLWSWFANTIVN